MSPLHAVERELNRHARALRALAKDLVGEANADDLVQETALRALRAPPAEPSGLFAWLATILRRLADNHRVAAARRQQRERTVAGAQPAAGPGADDELARRDSLRAVTASLFALPEPYQTTLVLRYFEDLTPAAIAQRTNVPLATVKSRLQRGLALLRDALDAKDPARQWRVALLSATGAAVPGAAAAAATAATATATTTTSGALLMANTGKLAAAAALLCGGALLLWQTARPPAVPHDAAATTADPIQVADAVAGGATPPTEPDRQALPPLDAQLAADLAHPFAFEAHVRVVDRDGLPVEGARIAFAPDGCALNTWPTATDAEGLATLRWHGRTSSMPVALGVIASGNVESLHRLAATAGVAHDVVLLGEAGGTQIHFRLAMAGQSIRLQAVGEPAADSCPRDVGGAEQVDCTKCHDTKPARHRVDAALRVRQALHPDATFADLLLPHAPRESATGDLHSTLAIAQALPGQDSFNLRIENANVLFGELYKATAASKPAAVETRAVAGTVFGEDGKPAPRTTVAVLRDGHVVGRARSRKDGTFRVEGLAPGTYVLRAGGGAAGLGIADLPVMAGVDAVQNVFLRREAAIRGTARDAAGKPLEDAVVEFEAAGEPWRDAVTVQQDGTFVLPNLPSGGGRLLLLPRGGGLPIAVLPSVLPDTGDVLLDVGRTAPANGSLRVQPVQASDAAPKSVEVRAWQVDTGRAVAMPRQADGSFLLTGLLAGFYRVEVLAEGSGCADLGQVFVDGRTATDLGVVTMPQPAVLVFANVPAEQTIELYHRREVGDVRAEELGRRERAELPAGRWLALWRDAAGTLHHRELQLEAGRETVLDLAAAH